MLKKQYGNQTVVNEVNQHIQKGRIYGLLGRNGAGKTTIVKTKRKTKVYFIPVSVLLMRVLSYLLLFYAGTFQRQFVFAVHFINLIVAAMVSNENPPQENQNLTTSQWLVGWL